MSASQSLIGPMIKVLPLLVQAERGGHGGQVRGGPREGRGHRERPRLRPLRRQRPRPVRQRRRRVQDLPEEDPGERCLTERTVLHSSRTVPERRVPH